MRKTGLLCGYLAVIALLGLAGPVWAAKAKKADAAVGMASHGTVAVAPTEAQAESAYQAARAIYVSQTGPQAVIATGMSPTVVVSGTVSDVLPGGTSIQNVGMDDINLVMDVDNVSLREVMAEVVRQAAVYTGPWTIKWRLKPENMSLLDERVNLTAESRFGEFCQLLTEKVKNMTGVQLFVTAFSGARVILVTDTYY